MIARRKLIYVFTSALVGLLALVRGFVPVTAQARLRRSPAPQTSSGSAYLFTFPGLKGGQIALNDYAGSVIMVVNTASFCGFTNQFKDLQALYNRYGSRGLVIIGVPSDDFHQEPGSGEEIAQFCSSEFGVTFPMTAKLPIKGDAAHPFYKWAAKQGLADTPRWNFFKYLIGRDGALAGAYGTTTGPLDGTVIAGIEAALAAES